jgi:hypothetical protein
MKRFAPTLVASLLAASLIFVPLAFAQGNTQSVPMPAPSRAASQQTPSADAHAWVQKHLAGWPQKTQRLGAQLVTKYGPPAETTERQITWYGNGPWKRTTLYKEEIQHNFANPHKDVLEQTINYRVPLEKFAELAQFNGSLVPNRTRGELSGASDGEDTNFLALNVADDIVKGERNLEQALTYYAQIIRAKMIKEPESYLEGLKFKPAKTSADTADPGEIAPLIKHMSGAESPD